MRLDRGFVLPLLTGIFKVLNFISPLTIVRRFGLGWSPIAVDIYVFTWFFIIFSLVWLIPALEPLPTAGLAIVVVVLAWRQLDILQAWFHIFIVPHPLRPASPIRSLALTVINYIELFLIFGLLAWVFRFENFYPPFATITESLRYSIGVITTAGSHFDPASVIGALIHYSELAFGLAFLIVIVGRVLSILKGPGT